MQNVSYAWRKNQAANVQQQAYCKIEITTRYGESAAHTTTLSSLTTKNDIKQVKHKRTFDPVSIALPTNTLTFTLYNYDEQYDDWYKTYSEYTTRIVTKNGYVLDGTQEEITGGAFYVTKIVRNNNHTITVTAVSKFDKLDEVLQLNNVYNVDDTETIFEFDEANPPPFSGNNWQVYQNDISLQLIKSYTVTSLLNTIFSNTVNFSIDSALGSKIVRLSRWYEIAKLKTLGFLLNWLQAKVTIDRNETVTITATRKLTYNSTIHNLNIMKNPLYELANKVNNVTMTTLDFKTTNKISEGAGIIQNYVATPTDGDSERGYFVRTAAFDYEKNQITRMGFYDFERQNHVTKVEKGIFVPDPHPQDNPEYEERCLRLTWQNLNSPREHPIGFSIIYNPLVPDPEMQQVTIDPNGRGITCDIKSSFLKPENPTTFAARLGNYFANRDLYTLEMRADPARDVGDYVYAELEPGVFSKVLILESELTFEGSFSEKTLVRKIHTDFETVTVDGGTPASSFTVVNHVATAYNGSASTVTMPLTQGGSAITGLGDNLFKNKTNLTQFNMAPVITSIGESCFEGCTRLTGIIIPDSVTTLGASVFSGCAALTDVVMSDSVAEVPENAFNGCAALESVHLPTKATRMGAYAFSGCTSLENITIPPSCAYIGDFCFSDSGLKLFCYPAVNSGYVRPGCFSGCVSLKKVVLPFRLARVGENAFLNCTDLEEVVFDLNAEVLQLDTDAFKNCASLQRLVLPYAPRTTVLRDIFGDTAYSEGGFNGTLYIKKGATALISWAESYGYRYEIIN